MTNDITKIDNGFKMLSSTLIKIFIVDDLSFYCTLLFYKHKNFHRHFFEQIQKIYDEF